MACAISRRHEIEVIGPLLGDAKIYAPYATELPYKPIGLPAGLSPLAFVRHLSRWQALVTGDVMYAFKPALASFGAALWLRRATGVPVLLDIEDWDAADFWTAPWSKRLRSLWTGLRHLASPQTFGAMECLVRAADERVVVSRFLQERFGGTRIVHGADCRLFDPRRYDREQLREQIGIRRGWRIILFAGTLLEHKGGEELVEAIRQTGRAEIKLMVLGRETADLRRLTAQMPDSIIHLGPRPHGEMPRFLAVADLVALPQRDTSYARAQIPGKVFEAMAMAKPVIAAAVSDLPEILDGCGIVVPAQDPAALASAMVRVIDDARLANQLGQNARQKCIERYSWDRMEEELDGVLQRLSRRTEFIPFGRGNERNSFRSDAGRNGINSVLGRA